MYEYIYRHMYTCIHILVYIKQEKGVIPVVADIRLAYKCSHTNIYTRNMYM